jgi:hypothetical protein
MTASHHQGAIARSHNAEEKDAAIYRYLRTVAQSGGETPTLTMLAKVIDQKSALANIQRLIIDGKIKRRYIDDNPTYVILATGNATSVRTERVRSRDETAVSETLADEREAKIAAAYAGLSYGVCEKAAKPEPRLMVLPPETHVHTCSTAA